MEQLHQIIHPQHQFTAPLRYCKFQNYGYIRQPNCLPPDLLADITEGCEPIMKSFHSLTGLVFGAAVLLAGTAAMAQADRPVYTENCVNNFSDSGHSLTYSVINTSPVHTGTYSINATITASGGYLYFQHGNFNSSPYGSVSFWINGGPAGGQFLKVYGTLNGTTQTAVALPKLMTNVWQQFIVPLSSLGCSNKSNFSGVRIQDALGGAQPVFYVDDVYLGAAPAPAIIHLNILAAQTNRLADARWFGVNTATWDGSLGNSATIPALKAAGITTLRWPGGSGADVHDWTTDISAEKTFNNVATNLGPNAQTFITVNYGTGTSNLAAGYVLFDNVTNHCKFKYWEIGNECYGTWETDNNTNNGFHPWDPYTYAVRAAAYMAAMRAADPTIKIGVPATPGDDSDSNGYNSHPATNLRTGQTHNGWTPVMLATLKSLGAKPDFLIHHVYPQYTQLPVATSPPARCVDSDMFLLQATGNWSGDAATLRQEISDYFGSGGTNIELCCTENNSDSSLGGKQLSSLVNGLYEADAMAHLMQTEFNSYLWWDLRNGTGSNGELDASLYGWRQYGDEGLITGATGYNPVYYAMKMMQYFARPGDTIVGANSDHLLLSTYAAVQTNGTLKVLVVNKDPVANFNGQLNFTGYLPASNAVIRTYGEAQDNATRDNLAAALRDIATNNLNSARNLFSYSFPPYSLTVFTFTPSGQIISNRITLSAQMAIGQDWNTTNLWSDGNAASNSAALPGYNMYEVLPNARLRTPAVGGGNFPGSLLTADGDGNFAPNGGPNIGEVRLESSPNTFPRLVMNGGQIDASIGGGAGIQCVINGEMDILANTPFYDDSANDAGYTINAFLTGKGQIEFRDLGFVMTNGNTMNIAGNTNAYSGIWNVIQGTLLGSGTNALGTNSITVGANGALETTYDLNNPGGNLTLDGQMLLHQNDSFQSLTVGGTAVFAGTYSCAYLSANYPAHFPAAWPLQSGSSISNSSGSITVLTGPPPPALSFQQLAGPNLVLNWSNAGLGMLLQATNITGPWSPVPDAVSPYTNPLSPAVPQMFFRLQAQ
jgi:alpha-L-arabinofuranosidase